MSSDDSRFGNGGAGDPRDRAFRAHFSPSQPDQSVRQALQMCWLTLPAERKTVDEVESQFRRLVDRALKDMRDDYDAFGYDSGVNPE